MAAQVTSSPPSSAWGKQHQNYRPNQVRVPLDPTKMPFLGLWADPRTQVTGCAGCPAEDHLGYQSRRQTPFSSTRPVARRVVSTHGPTHSSHSTRRWKSLPNAM